MIWFNLAFDVLYARIETPWWAVKCQKGTYEFLKNNFKGQQGTRALT